MGRGGGNGAPMILLFVKNKYLCIYILRKEIKKIKNMHIEKKACIYIQDWRAIIHCCNRCPQWVEFLTCPVTTDDRTALETPSPISTPEPKPSETCRSAHFYLMTLQEITSKCPKCVKCLPAPSHAPHLHCRNSICFTGHLLLSHKRNTCVTAEPDTSNVICFHFY